MFVLFLLRQNDGDEVPSVSMQNARTPKLSREELYARAPPARPEIVFTRPPRARLTLRVMWFLNLVMSHD